MKRTLVFTLALALLAVHGGLATAATTVKSSKSNSSDRALVIKHAPKRMTGKVTEVDGRTRTFTILANGKAVVFSAADLGKLPKVGEIVDVTYEVTPGGGPFKTSNLNLSKSNVN